MKQPGYAVELHYIDPQTKAAAYLTLKRTADPDEARALEDAYAARVRAGTLGDAWSAVRLESRPPLPTPPHEATEGPGYAVLQGQDEHARCAAYAGALYLLTRHQLAGNGQGWCIRWEGQPAGDPAPFGGFGVVAAR